MTRSARTALRRGWEALRPDADLREVFEQESAAANVRNGRLAFPVLIAMHVVFVVLFSRTAAPTPAHAAWLTWLARIHGALLVWAVAALVATRNARSPRTGIVIGDTSGAVYLLATALMVVNVLPIQPNLNMFTVAAMGTAYIVRVRPRVYLAAIGAGAAIVAGGLFRYVAEPSLRSAHFGSLAVIVGMSLVGYTVVRVMRLRELRARHLVEKMNVDLEGRVASQIQEITERAKQIDELNVQLNQQVRERSRELSMALARLADEHQRLAPGTVLGDRVEIEARIGEGGMGAVYRARDLVTGGTVAVKVVQAGSVNELDGLYRFLREAQALASLTHPAIVRSFHVDVADDGRLFQVMELVNGQTLQAWLDRDGSLDVPAAARLGAVLGDALANAHAAGIVHRDVKPANVMLTSASPGIKLLDFGVSKLRDARAASAGGRSPDAARASHGRTEGNVIGTPEFLSPEQIQDPANVGDRADVYALGLVLYRAITGRPPYDTVSARSWLVAHVAQPPEEITTVVLGVDREVASTVMACLGKTPEQRPSAREVARSLATCADRLGCPSLESLWGRAPLLPPHEPAPEHHRTGVKHAEITGRRTLKVVR